MALEGVELADLFYTLRLNSEDFDRRILQSGDHLKDFVSYAEKHPLAVTGALSAAFIGVGVQATKMAADVDAAMRRIEAALPGSTSKLGALRDIIADISKISPRSQQELAEAAASIAEHGVENIDDIESRLKVAVQVADATGADLGTVVEGLGTVIDQFHLSTEGGTNALIRLFGAAQGKFPLEDLFTVLKNGGSTLAALGVSAQDAGDAMAALIQGGVPNRQAGTVLTQILALGDPANIARLKQGTDAQQQAAAVIAESLSRSTISTKGFGGALADLASGLEHIGVDSREFGIQANVLNAIQRAGEAAAHDHRTEEEKLADAQKAAAAAADVNTQSATALYQILKNNLSDALIQLGVKILPAATRALTAFDNVLSKVLGTGNRLQDVQALTGSLPTVDQLGPHDFRRGSFRAPGSFLGGMTPEQQQADQFYNALNDFEAQFEKRGNEVFAGIQMEQLQKLSDNLDTLFRRDPSKLTAKLDILRVALTDVIHAGTAASATGGKGGTGTEGATGGAIDLGLTAAQIDAIKQQLGTLKFAMQDAFAAGTSSPVDNARLQLQKFRDALDEIEKKVSKGSPLVQDAEALYAELANPKTGLVASAQAKVDADAQQQLDKLLADADSKVAQVKQLYDGLIKDVTEKGANPAIIKGLEAARQKALDAAKAMDSVNAALTGVEGNIVGREVGLPTGTPMSDMGVLLDQLDQQNAALEHATEHSTEWYTILAEIKRTTADIKALQDGVAKSTQDTTAAEQAAKTAHAQYVDSLHNDFNEALQGAEQVVAMFGKIDERTQAVLNGISDWGNAAAAFAKGDLISSAIDTIEGALSMAKGLFGFGSGKSQAQKDAERLLDQNTQAILKLNEHIGALNQITATGSEIGVFQQVLARTDITGGTKLHAQQQTYRIQDFLEANGLTIADFRAFAESLGVKLSDAITADEFQQLQKAAAEKLPQATTFGDDFAGQTAKFNAAVNLLDLTTPAQQFAELAKDLGSIKGGAGAFGELLKTFDLTTPAGIQAATQALQTFFTNMSSLTTAQLGGLSAQDLLNAQQMVQSILQSAQSGTATGTGGYNVDRTITDVTGSRLAALLSTGNVFEEQTAKNTALIASILSGGTLPVITPPAVPVGGFGASAGVSSVAVTFAPGSIVVQIPASAASDPASLGATVEQAVKRAITDPSTVTTLSQRLRAEQIFAARSQGQLQS